MTDDNAYRAHVGKSIRLARGKAKLSQVVLADTLGVDQPEISRWERGVHLPSLRYQRALCEALDITLADLFGGYDT